MGRLGPDQEGVGDLDLMQVQRGLETSILLEEPTSVPMI